MYVLADLGIKKALQYGELISWNIMLGVIIFQRSKEGIGSNCDIHYNDEIRR